MTATTYGAYGRPLAADVARVLARPGMSEGTARRMRETHEAARMPFPFDRCATFHTERAWFWGSVAAEYSRRRDVAAILGRCE